jgi:hypothetical protein
MVLPPDEACSRAKVLLASVSTDTQAHAVMVNPEPTANIVPA